MAGNTGGRSSSPEKVPHTDMWEKGQILKFARVAHTLSFSATGLSGFARRRPTITPMGAVTPHSPSR